MVRALSSRDLIRLLEEDEWSLVRVRGSHYHFRHPRKPGIVTVPHPKRDLPLGTVRSVLRAARLVRPHR